MSIKVTKRSTVKPAEEAPRRSLWLSSLDLVYSPHWHAFTVMFYRRRCNKDHQNNDDEFEFFNTETLKESLSRALVPFYPLAGRLRFSTNDINMVENNQQPPPPQQQPQQRQRIEVDCNGEGALFIEAETTNALSDLEENGHFAPDEQLTEVVMPRCDYSLGISSFPLLIVQLTRFNCGGVALGLSLHHQLVDGASGFHFVVSWARLARGVGLEFPPILDRTTYLSPRSPPQVPFHHLEYDQDMPSLLPTGDSELDHKAVTGTSSVSVFKLSSDQLSALKLATTSLEEVSSNCKLSTFEVVAGHVWRSACKARGLAHDQEVKVWIPVDGRSTLGVPKGYFGNVIFHAACVAKAGDIMSKPLWYAASEIHKAVKKVKDKEYLRSVVDYLDMNHDVTIQSRMPGKCPNLFINSWTRLPFYDVDFGWGEPVFGGHGGIKSEGRVYIMQSKNGDGSLLVAAKLFTHHMPLFQSSLYDF